MVQLSIIIVNYRSGSFILDCLKSAFQFPSAHSFEWIVVDNDSNDNMEGAIRAEYPMLRWVNMGYNAGFARANNEGIRISSAPVVLLLNPDTIIIGDGINLCLGRMTQNQPCIAAATQLINPDGSSQITGNFFMKGGLNHLLPLPYLGKILRTLALTGGAKKTNVPQAAQEEPVDWINGAFLMVKKTAIAKVGMLDEDFFLYAEEIEWCSRLGKAGKLVVYGDISTIHLQGESINEATGSPDKGYFNLYDNKGLQLMVSNHLRIRKQFGAGWFLFHLCVFTAEISFFFVCSFFHHALTLQSPFSDWAKIKGYSKNVMTLIKLSPTILRNRAHFYKMF
jgi:hypothetical protein